MQLHFKSFGSGTPLIILHGMLGMLDNWQSFGLDVSDHYLTYLMDLRNHGKSSWDSRMDYMVMAEDVRETMEAQWMFEGAIILGHSMGGKTAMQLALAQPELVKALIVIDIAPIEYPGGHEIILQALQNIDIESITSRQEVLEDLSQTINSKSVVHFLMKNLSRNKDGSYRWKVNLEAVSDNYQALLSAPVFEDAPFYGPTLFVRGGQSNYILDEHLTKIDHWFPNNKLASIDSAGHWIHVDAPRRLQEIILTFTQQSGL
ncbi:MAG: alpha/beta fold hydrolase [Saprospiraceae bacterium]|nr:alpha/beta fold hydrolase [Saprospiraceae bacterium]